MVLSGRRAKIKNSKNETIHIPFDQKFYTDHFLIKNHILKINSLKGTHKKRPKSVSQFLIVSCH